MGIKGLFKIIGSGDRKALVELAVKNFEKTGRPYRVAVDVSIWLFQVQSGPEGGPNPALRALYFRLLRLVGLSIQPLFVFDGPNKPPLKRNKATTAHHGGRVMVTLAKQMFGLFGFPFRTAPGEAEAECAALQMSGVVDAVIGDDVDTLMFGCEIMLSKMGGEGKSRIPTHVSVYQSAAIKGGVSGLDRYGMILVALMSGGDYCPAGIPGCGVKTACEAAKAGFGEDLCNINDDMEYSKKVDKWRDMLKNELATNESQYFKTRHKALNIPDTFPDKTVMQYYTHPEVSSDEELSLFRQEIRWNLEINIIGLRTFVARYFGWDGLVGAKKFIRGLAPVLVTYRLQRYCQAAIDVGEPDTATTDNSKLVHAVCGKRIPFDVGGMPEFKVAYVPAVVVGLDLDNEDPNERAISDHESEIDNEEYDKGDARICSTSPSKRRTPSYDPNVVAKTWVLDPYVRRGAPSATEVYESNVAAAEAQKIQEAERVQKRKEAGRIQKRQNRVERAKKTKDTNNSIPMFFKATKQLTQESPHDKNTTTGERVSKPRREEISKAEPAPKRGRKAQLPTAVKNKTINPWSLARRSSDIELTTSGLIPTTPDKNLFESSQALEVVASSCTAEIGDPSKACPPSLVEEDFETGYRGRLGDPERSPQRTKLYKSRLRRRNHQNAKQSEREIPRLDHKVGDNSPPSIFSGPLPQLSAHGRSTSLDLSTEPSDRSVHSSSMQERQSVVLRRSLSGSWEPARRGPVTPSRRFSAVEVIDMTKT